jgi:hypothetical protein
MAAQAAQRTLSSGQLCTVCSEEDRQGQFERFSASLGGLAWKAQFERLSLGDQFAPCEHCSSRQVNYTEKDTKAILCRHVEQLHKTTMTSPRNSFENL